MIFEVVHGGSLSLKVTSLLGIKFEKKNIPQSFVKNIELFMNIFAEK